MTEKLTEEEFLKRVGEFQHLFNIVEEPIYSRERILKINTEDEDYNYWYERFIKYGGNPNDLR